MSIANGVYYSRTAIDVAEAARMVPALAATEEHHSRSDRYGYIPTTHVLDGLIKEGFRIHGIQEAKTRRADRAGFQKHLVRLRRPEHGNDGEAPEVIIINSHDGSCAYQLLTGMIRFACANGLIAGDKWSTVRVQHSGDVVSKVIEGTYKVMDTFERMTETAKELRGITLTDAEQVAFARAALPLRFDMEDGKEAPFKAERLLQPRRYEDNRPDLWSTFNRVQENAIKGGQSGFIRGANGRLRRTSTREVNGIDGNVKLNQALFTLAEEMAKLKAA